MFAIIDKVKLQKNFKAKVGGSNIDVLFRALCIPLFIIYSFFLVYLSLQARTKGKNCLFGMFRYFGV